MKFDDLYTIHKEHIREIHPDVLSATDDELIAGGWGDWQRINIPGNWREVDHKTWVDGQRRKNKLEYNRVMRSLAKIAASDATEIIVTDGGKKRDGRTRAEKIQSHAAKMRERARLRGYRA